MKYMKLSTFVFVFIMAIIYAVVVYDLFAGSGRNGDKPIDRMVERITEGE